MTSRKASRAESRKASQNGRRIASAVLLAIGALPLTAGDLRGEPAPAAAAVPGECSAQQPRHIDPDTTRNEPLAKLGATAGLWRHATGQGVTVAVVDSGVDAANEHFPDGAVLPGTSFVEGFPNARESAVSHGTAVAGLVAARRIEVSGVVGLAPDATLLPVRAFVSDNPNDEIPGLEPTPARMAAGIRWAADAGADVINVSMSSVQHSVALDQAVRHATRSGALVVASAGNNEDGPEHPTTRPVWPAASPGALGVTAAAADDSVTDWSVHGPHVDVSAPGQNVLAPNRYAGDCLFPGGSNEPGEPITSFATPYVSATAALLMQAHPDESPRQIAYRIIASADRPVQRARDARRGWGFLRPYEALTMTVDPSRAGPPVPGAARSRAMDEAPRNLVDYRPAADPMADSRRSTAWWLLLGGAAVVLLMLSRWAVLARRSG